MITLQNKHSIIVQVLMQTSASDVQGRAKKNQYVLEIQDTIPLVTFYKEIEKNERK